MFIFEDGALISLTNKEQWFEESINVFAGQFTVEDDKWHLVDTVLGLYAHTLQGSSMEDNFVRKLLVEHKKTVFPPKYFGDLIEMLEDEVDTLAFDKRVVESSSLPEELSALERENVVVKRGSSLKDMFRSAVSAASDPRLSSESCTASLKSIRGSSCASGDEVSRASRSQIRLQGSGKCACTSSSHESRVDDQNVALESAGGSKEAQDTSGVTQTQVNVEVRRT